MKISYGEHGKGQKIRFPVEQEKNMTINGVSKTGYANATVAEMLQREGYKISQVAIELNEQILPKGQYEDTVLKEDDVIEVVSFMGGGC